MSGITTTSTNTPPSFYTHPNQSAGNKAIGTVQVAVINYPDGSKYDGQMENNHRHGHGTLAYANGETYVGQWENDQRHGDGTYKYANGETYVGEWENGQQHGRGTCKYANGETYVGQWENGQRHGEGTHTYPNKAFYVGQWKHDLQHGHGSFEEAKGSYVGEWENGQQHGRGTCKYANGETYVGQWENGQRHGEGTHTYPNKAFYVGQWKHDLQHGHGSFEEAKGSYVGEWENGQPHGYGRFRQANGICYKGQWENGQPHGQGMAIYSDIIIQVSFNKNRAISDIHNLTDELFISLLLGIQKSSPTGYSAGIIADFLNKNNYKKFYEKLQQSMQLSTDRDKTQVIQTIFSEIIHRDVPFEGRNYLFYYGYPEHSMGLNIVREAQHPDSVFLEIFNSGEGLEEYHSKKGKKFQTMLRIKISLSNITLAHVENRIKAKERFQNIHECYEAILKLPATILKQNENTAVYQTRQKSGNCDLEWTSAYFANKMTKLKYTEFRLALFKACRDGIQHGYSAAPQSTKFNRLEAIAELQRKIEKREERILTFHLCHGLMHI